MLPIPETSVWSSSARLSPVRRWRSPRDERGLVECGSSSVAGDVQRPGPAASARPSDGEPARPPGRPSGVGTSGTTASPPNIRWSTNRSSRRPVAAAARPIRTRRCALGRRRPAAAARAGRSSRGAPAAPRRSRGSSQRNLPRRTTSVTVDAAQPGGEVVGAGLVPAHRPRVPDLDRRRRPCRPPSGPGRGGPPRPRAARARVRHRLAVATAASTGGRRRAVAGVAARRLGVRARPAAGGTPPRRPRPARPPSCCARCRCRTRRSWTIATAWNSLAWSGPSSVDGVLRARRDAAVAVSSCRLRLPVQPGAQLGARTPAAGRPAGARGRGRRRCRAQVDRAEQRLEGVGEDRGLVPAAAGLLAAAEQQVLAQGRGRGRRPASARMLTTAARSLASWPSGRSGCRR